ncbi:MAG: cell division protein ZipA [Candidatus Thiodiazotropha sp. (ex Semelilucina semeliformis)]|nr:cell division protein ZipA [Candidatus Thiodiazotropha sp. (ex Semelilucina semeliformis)]
MDATTLRIVLLVAGVIFLGAIYLYETQRRKKESAQARRRVTEKMQSAVDARATEPSFSTEPYEDEDTEPYEDEDEGLVYSTENSVLEGARKHSAFNEEPETLDSIRIDDSPIPGIDNQVESKLEFSANSMDEPDEGKPSEPMEQQDLFTFSAQEESPVDVPDLILQINIRAKKTPFDGVAIEKAMQETGMQLSELAIYQRLTSDGSNKVLYGLASMVEPGVFPLKSMQEFSTPGLTLFTQLPGPGDGLMIFSDMLYTAERLSAMLQGDLQDDTHSALTKQTIEHLRERIMEHKRQIQLARRKG